MPVHCSDRGTEQAVGDMNFGVRGGVQVGDARVGGDLGVRVS